MVVVKVVVVGGDDDGDGDEEVVDVDVDDDAAADVASAVIVKNAGAPRNDALRVRGVVAVPVTSFCVP